MSKVRKLFEQHLDDVRGMARESQEQFINLLASLIQGGMPSSWNGSGASLEAYLIELYRLEFYEWAANLAMVEANARTGQRRGNKKGGDATKILQEAKGEATKKEIHAKADELLRAGKDKQVVAGIIKKRLPHYGKTTIYTALHSHSSGLWSKN